MKVIHFIIVITIWTFGFGNAVAQSNKSSSQRQMVLQEGIVDSTFIFGKWTEQGEGETHLTYLGQVTTRNHQTFKLMNSIWFRGLSHRATSRILVFNDKNQYVGNYYLTLTTDLPTRLDNGKLIFKNSTDDCDNTLTTIVDLGQGLPKQFFRKCKGEMGDIYSFSTE